MFGWNQADNEVVGLTNRIRLLEEDYDQTANRLKVATAKLEEASQAAEESEK